MHPAGAANTVVKQVNNLEERVKIDTMKEALTRVFNYYGPVLDIIAKSSLKRKGQAFVVFDSEKSTLDAIEEMNGFELYGKPLKVARAKTHSDETVKRKAVEMFEEHKRKRLMLKGAFVFGVLRWAGTEPTTYAALANGCQTSSAQRKTPKPRLRPPPPRPRSRGQPRRAPRSCPTSTCGPTRRCSCRTSRATWTRRR